MRIKTWKRLLTITMTAGFLLATFTATLAQRPRGGNPPGGQRPPNAQRGQRPPNAGRENSPYADMHKNGQVKPPEARGKRGRP
jgi:hypothetical protein